MGRRQGERWVGNRGSSGCGQKKVWQACTERQCLVRCGVGRVRGDWRQGGEGHGRRRAACKGGGLGRPAAADAVRGTELSVVLGETRSVLLGTNGEDEQSEGGRGQSAAARLVPLIC